jgi:hypothetical protein
MQLQQRTASGTLAANRSQRQGVARAAPLHAQRQQQQQFARRRLTACAASGNSDDDGAAPEIMGDWRAFRAKLLAQSGESEWSARRSEDNMRLLETQNPNLAAEEVWAHAVAGPERGGLLIAAPNANQILGSERYWQVRAGEGGERRAERGAAPQVDGSFRKRSAKPSATLSFIPLSYPTNDPPPTGPFPHQRPPHPTPTHPPPTQHRSSSSSSPTTPAAPSA